MMRTFYTENAPIKAWVNGVHFAEDARRQLVNLAQMPFIFRHVAAMPDVHFGKGATIGSVFAAEEAIIPAAVGVDIGCGMNAARLNIKAGQLPDSLKDTRVSIEEMVPVGFGRHTPERLRRYKQHSSTAENLEKSWRNLSAGFGKIIQKHPGILKRSRQNLGEKSLEQLGTLGGGNHFIELCIDENDDVWVMLHSGSRGVGSCIGRYFIELAKKDMGRHLQQLPDRDLAYLRAGTAYYEDYLEAVEWAQAYAKENRRMMMKLVIAGLKNTLPEFMITEEAINCHHNYVNRENHFGCDVYVTRKGAVHAGKDVLGIIPGSMGAKSFIVKGLGNEESFRSCSHGAGRIMSRTAAKKTITEAEHISSTDGVECRKDAGVIDESPAAYKDIDAVMSAQEDLVEIVHTLKQVVCVKG